MRLFNSIDISSTGLIASRIRMDIISSNLANASTTRTEGGGAYRRKTVVFKEKAPTFSESLHMQMNRNNSTLGKGVKVDRITNDISPFKLVYEPSHPDANEDGYVEMPNVNVVAEMVDMISATRAYEANVTAVNSAKNMVIKALEIGRG